MSLSFAKVFIKQNLRSKHPEFIRIQGVFLMGKITYFRKVKVLQRRLYSIYFIGIFTLVFALLLIPFLIIIQVPAWRKYVAHLNRTWSKLFYIITFMPLEVIMSKSIDKKGSYIFCPNHASYLDIPIMGNTPTDFLYVGKNAMEKVPVFGYMYRKLHITVDRNSLKSKHSTYIRSKEAIDNGRSLVIFPEGGIFAKHPPQMIPFKNGAFKIAIEKQIPIVPVTIPHNWIILPDDGRYLLRRRKARLIYHDPIETYGLTLSDLDSLKEKVYKTIDQEIKKYHHIKNKLSS